MLFIEVTLDHLGILAVVVIDRELGQLVCNAIVAVDTGLTFCQAAFMTFTRVTVLLTEIHGFELMAVAALPGIRRAHRFPYTLRQVQSACFEFLRRVNLFLAPCDTAHWTPLSCVQSYRSMALAHGSLSRLPEHPKGSCNGSFPFIPDRHCHAFHGRRYKKSWNW